MIKHAALWCAFVFLLVTAHVAHAVDAGAVAGAVTGEAICQAWWKGTCQNGKKQPCPPIPCTAGIGKGMCKPPGTCSGESATGMDGKDSALDKGLQGLMQALQGILGQLGKGGGGKGGGEGSGGGGGMPSSGQQAQQPLPTNVADLQNAVQNAQATQKAGDSVNDILGSVFGQGGASETLPSTGVSVSNGIDAVAGSTTQATTTSGTTVVAQGAAQTPSASDAVSVTAAQGEQARSSANGGALEVGVRNQGSNSEVSGFYADATQGGQSGLVGSVCVSRPWASGVASYFLSPSFFDSLCAKWGYSTTAPVVVRQGVNTTKAERAAVTTITTNSATIKPGISCAPEVVRPGGEATLSFSCGKSALSAVSGFSAVSKIDTSAKVKPAATTQYAIKCADESVHACTVTVVNPKVTIWAEPAQVSLGSRALIYWNSKDVFPETCVAKGPSFNERGGYGGASTVSINDPSTFTLTCLGLDGATSTAQVTVELSL